MKNVLLLLLLIAVPIFFSACSVRRSEPIKGKLTITDPAVKNGQVVYMKYCQKCHPIGESGLGPSVNSNPAPQFVKRFQVRHGLGVMPAFSDEVISDADLKDISRYMKALKKNK